MKWTIPLFKIFNDKSDLEAVTKVIKRGQQWACGPEIKQFENIIRKKVESKYCLVFSSGTNALFSLLEAIGIEGKEVIIPAFTFVATSNVVKLVRGIPIYAEIEDETYGLSYEDTKKKITKKTKAIILVHYAGGIAKDTLKIRRLCKQKHILLIEDAAEAIGTQYKGKYAGTFGFAGMYSFCQNKVLTTSEGGTIIINNKKIYERMKLIRDHGNKRIPGHNFRMSTLLASLGISQFAKLNKFIEMRQTNAHYYNKRLKGINEIKIPEIMVDSIHTFQMYTIRLKNKKIRDSLKDYLLKKGIQTKVYFEPIRNLKRTNKISKEVLTLPITFKTKSEQKYIIKQIKRFFKKK